MPTITCLWGYVGGFGRTLLNLLFHFLPSCGEGGHCSWSFVPGYGMVNRLVMWCSFMQPLFVWWLVQRWYSPLVSDIQRIAVEINTHQLTEAIWASGETVSFSAASSGNLLAWAVCWCINRGKAVFFFFLACFVLTFDSNSLRWRAKQQV